MNRNMSAAVTQNGIVLCVMVFGGVAVAQSMRQFNHEQIGVVEDRGSTGTALADVDGDGDNDIISKELRRSPNRHYLLRNTLKD